MTHTLLRHLHNSAAILLLLFLLASVAHAQRMLEPAELLQDQKFKSVYFKGLGPKAKTPWLAKLDGPAPTTRKVQVDGTEYVLAAVCKNHDCADNNTVLLYSAPKGVVYGTIYERGKSTLIGEPPPTVAAELPKLWKIEWRQQR